MIEGLQFITTFCFWLFLALVMMGICIISLWVLIHVLRNFRERHD